MAVGSSLELRSESQKMNSASCLQARDWPTRDGEVAPHAREFPRCEEVDQINKGWGSTVVFPQNPFPPRVIPAAFANRNPGVRVRIFNCDVNVNDVARRSLSRYRFLNREAHGASVRVGALQLMAPHAYSRSSLVDRSLVDRWHRQ